MWDQKTGRSRGFGFVSFRNQQVLFSFDFSFFFQTDIVSSNNFLQYFISFVQDAQSAINDITGKDGVVLLQICSFTIFLTPTHFHVR